MKNYTLNILFGFLLFLTSCSSGGSSDVNPSVYSVEGVWEYDYWNYDGTNLLSDYEAYIFLCEETGIFATEIYDASGFITNISTAGYFTINDDNTFGVFDASLQYDPINGNWVNIDVFSLPISINKLDINELDFSISYTGGVNEIIRTVKTNLDACLILSAKKELLQ
ncbi:MAG: hypothetical protein CMJ05_10980 [Pelagibacterales bacterium]|nr:hypothetical protein [Pelagibacterales bacterium]|tara:strand:- start:239 stop:739 length:501 start_codon:yes stop_codon:yes gene_type:complete